MNRAARLRDCGVSFKALPGWVRRALVIVNSLSLVFDVIDSWRWLAGERTIPGFPANACH